MKDYNDLWPDIGARFTKIRETLNLSRETLADSLNIPAAHVADLESGKHHPNIHCLHRLILKYDANAEYLLMGRGPMFTPGALPARPDDTTNRQGVAAVEDIIWYANRSKIFRNNIIALAARYYDENKDLLENAVQQETRQRSSQDTRPISIRDADSLREPRRR